MTGTHTPIYRLLTVEDSDIFRALRLRACKEEPAAFLETYEDIADLPAEHFRKHFENGWIASGFVDGILAGKAGLYRHTERKSQHKGVLWGVYVIPEMRGRGIAKHCIEMVIEEATRAGLEQVLLDTDVTSAASVGLYQKLGFEGWGVEKHIAKLPDRYVDGLFMTRFLRQS